MDDPLPGLRRKLSVLKDDALDFIGRVETGVTPEPGPEDYFRSERTPDMWMHLNPEAQAYADDLRSRVRQLMVELGQLAQQSILLGEPDIRLLGLNAKRMTAALRFKDFRHWGIHIHHDEGVVLGVDPAGQSEDDPISAQEARRIFSEGYTKTLELMDFLSARKERINSTGTGSTHILTYKRGTAFVMMWMNPKRPDLSDVKDVVKEVFKEFGVEAIRSDEIEHSEGVTGRVIEEIRTSEFLFADLTGERPSVYYEIGYAHALGKTVILYRKKGTDIHFDLAYRNCPEYENLGDLRTKLRKRLTAMTDRAAPGGEEVDE